MKPFSAVAIPHKDILEGKFRKDTFAASLWEVYKGRAAEDYLDTEIFFKKTYLTEGISTLLNMLEERFKGKEGLSIIQFETPFGGGKTHSLIALYHKAKELNAKTIVFDGGALNPKNTLIWEEMERQLTGKVEKFKGSVPPAGEELRELFSKHQPLLILIDEILDYTISASDIKINNTFLSTQILNFVRFLTDSVRSLDRTTLVITYPSKSHYDEHGQRLFELLQERTGRVSVPYLPIKDEEIPNVVTTRLFKSIDKKAARETIKEFLEYAESEKLLLEDKATYRKKFENSFPFQPEVIDVLYKRWGSFPRFERTRGVLFLLASVVHKLKNSQLPFIRLADFDLNDDRIRAILTNVAGPEWNSVIAQDITSSDSGAKKVEKALPSAFSPYSLGTNIATTIFLYSFAGGPERGATINEIKLSCAHTSIPSSIIVEALQKLYDPLTSIYLDYKHGRYFYTTEITLPRVLLEKMEGIGDDEIKSMENKLLMEIIKKGYFEVYPLPTDSKDIPDTRKLKLVILQSPEKCVELWERCGGKARVNRNTMFFICPIESERKSFQDFLKRKLAWQLIEKDKTLKLTPEQMEEVKAQIKKAESEAKERVRNFYRRLFLPSREGLREEDLGIHTFGTETAIDKEVYQKLKNEGEILESLSPRVIKEKYLKDQDFVETKSIFETFFTTPGEIRIVSEQVLKTSISEGVKQGLFGLGDLENGKPICRRFKEECLPELVEGEILIKAELCKPEERFSDEEFQMYIDQLKQVETPSQINEIIEKIPFDRLTLEQKEKLEKLAKERKSEIEGRADRYRVINLKLGVPLGKLSNVVQIVNYIKEKFKQVDIKVEISSRDGEITASEYENTIKKTISLAKLSVEEERKE